LSEVSVTGDQVVPGIEDGDDGFALQLAAIDSGLLDARAMPEGTQVIGAKKAITPEFFRFFTRE
jgi:hypothetical protein